MDNKDIKKLLHNRVLSLYEEWKLYAEKYAEDLKNFQSKKENIAKQIMADDSSIEDFKEEVEFLAIGSRLKAEDLNKICQKLVEVYKLAEQTESIEDLDSTYKEEIENLSGKIQQTFVAEKDGLKEIIKGTQQKYIDQIKENGQYKQIVDFFKREK